MARVRYITVKEEAAFAGGAAAPWSQVLDLASADIDAPGDGAIIYQSASRRANSKFAAAPYVPQGPISFAADDANIGWFLKWALGGYSVAAGGAAGSYVHTFTPSDTLKSFQTNVGKDVFEHQFLGCMIDSLQLQVEKEFLMVTPEIRAAKDAKAAIVSNNTIPTNALFAYNQITTTLAGTDVTGDVLSIDLQISNNLNTDDGVALGSRFPKRFDLGDLEISQTMKVYFKDSAQYERFWGQTGGTGPQENLITQSLAWTAKGALIGGTTYKQLVVTMPKVIYKQVQAPVKGVDRIEQTVTVTALHDDGTGYPIQVQLTNATATY